MKVFDRHILVTWVKSFSLVLGATLGLLILEDIYDDLIDLIGYGAGLRDVAHYYLVLLPSFLPTVLPVSLMISILFSLGRLHRNNEIIAMRACGLSLLRITRTLWIAGFVFSVGLFGLNAHLVPWSVEQSRNMVADLKYAHAERRQASEDIGVIQSLTFYNFAERRLWFMNRFNERNYRGFGVTVSFLDLERREARRVVANEVYYDNLDNGWVFLHGREIWFDVAADEPVRSLPFERREFAELTEDPMLMKYLEDLPRDLSLRELATVTNQLSEGGDPRVRAYQVRYHGIMANPVSAMIAVALAVPFAVAGVRVNPMIGVSKSIGLFFLYYLVSSIATLLGERDILDPISSAWLPNALMLALALWFYRRAT